MKKQLLVSMGSILIFILLSFRHQSLPTTQQSLTGAWHLQHATIEEVLIFQDGYFSHTVFDKSNKKFISSYGGIYKPGATSVLLKTEFDTRAKEDIGKEKTVVYAIAANLLTTDITDQQQNGQDWMMEKITSQVYGVLPAGWWMA